MKIVIDYPPLFEMIDAKFHVKGQPVMFTFNGTIYNPEGGKITRELHKHEEVHYQQQGDKEADAVFWWGSYCADGEEGSKFRLNQELPAHQIEYKAFCKRHGDHGARNKYLSIVARRLSGELYGNLLPFEEAVERIIHP